MEIRALTIDDVDVYRSIRLRALAANPEAFEATYAPTAEHDDDTWKARLTGFAGRPGQVFVADVGVGDAMGGVADEDGTGEAVVGMVGVGESELPGDCVVWGMWVDASRRGGGIGVALLDAAVEWARERGAATVSLWVMRANEGAKTLYERHGFVEQAELRPDAPTGCADQPCLRLTVTPGD